MKRNNIYELIKLIYFYKINAIYILIYNPVYQRITPPP